MSSKVLTRLAGGKSGRINADGGETGGNRRSIRESVGLAIETIGEKIAGHHKIDGPPPEPVDTPWLIQEAHGAWSLSDDGATIYHERKGHDIGLPGIVLKTGVTKLSFKVTASHNNKGHNLFIGVMDADAPRTPPPLPEPTANQTERAPGATNRTAPTLGAGKGGAAWGYHPYDGMIYYTPDAYQRGVKGAVEKEGQVMRELPHMRGDAEGQILHVVVDMDNKKLLMAVNTDEPVDVGITLPVSVQPYVFFDWREDAVELLGNVVPLVLRQPSRRHMAGKSTARQARTARAKPKAGMSTDRRVSKGEEKAPLKPPAADARTFTVEQHLELALAALMAVHKSDSLALNNGIPGFSLGENPSRNLMLKELERCATDLQSPSADALQA